MTPADELRDVREHVWESLGCTPLRRAMLGRERADAITRVAVDACRDEATHGRSTGNVFGQAVEFRVKSQYVNREGFAFMSVLIGWAISAIVQAVVAHWLNNREAAK